MDITALLALIPTQYIPYVTAAITTCGILCALMPPPKTTTGIWFNVYQVINTIALNWGHAKSLSAPESTGIVGGPGATSAPLVATNAVPMATATPAQKAVTIPAVSIPTGPIVPPPAPAP